MKALSIVNQILITGATLLYALWMLHLTYPKAYHWLESKLLDLWEWLIAANGDPTWEARWEQMWGDG